MNAKIPTKTGFVWNVKHLDALATLRVTWPNITLQLNTQSPLVFQTALSGVMTVKAILMVFISDKPESNSVTPNSPTTPPNLKKKNNKSLNKYNPLQSTKTNNKKPSSTKI